jgi:hypothetical protein
MAVFFQPGGEGENPNGRHAVGQDGKVGLARDEVESGRVDEGDAHAVF